MKLKGIIGSGVVTLALVVTMALTCPPKEKHVQVVAEAMTQALDVSMREEGMHLPGFGAKLSTKFNKMVLNYGVHIDNFFIFNVGTFTFAGESQIVSVGLLGHVFTAPKELIAAYFEDKILDLGELIDKSDKN